VWLVVYQSRGTSYQGAVNAVTGRACARFPKSAWKIALVVVLALALAALVLCFLNR
jgi:hypothetical protein